MLKRIEQTIQTVYLHYIKYIVVLRNVYNSSFFWYETRHGRRAARVAGEKYHQNRADHGRCLSMMRRLSADIRSSAAVGASDCRAGCTVRGGCVRGSCWSLPSCWSAPSFLSSSRFLFSPALGPGGCLLLLGAALGAGASAGGRRVPGGRPGPLRGVSCCSVSVWGVAVPLAAALLPFCLGAGVSSRACHQRACFRLR
jgi:hypothetical protein